MHKRAVVAEMPTPTMPMTTLTFKYCLAVLEKTTPKTLGAKNVHLQHGNAILPCQKGHSGQLLAKPPVGQEPLLCTPMQVVVGLHQGIAHVAVLQDRGGVTLAQNMLRSNAKVPSAHQRQNLHEGPRLLRCNIKVQVCASRTQAGDKLHGEPR
jgi:hypothetical protein